MPIAEHIQPPEFRELIRDMTKLEGKRPNLEDIKLTLLQVAEILQSQGEVAHFLFPRWGLSTLSEQEIPVRYP